MIKVTVEVEHLGLEIEVTEHDAPIRRSREELPLRVSDVARLAVERVHQALKDPS